MALKKIKKVDQDGHYYDAYVEVPDENQAALTGDTFVRNGKVVPLQSSSTLVRNGRMVENGPATRGVVGTLEEGDLTPGIDATQETMAKIEAALTVFMQQYRIRHRFSTWFHSAAQTGG